MSEPLRGVGAITLFVEDLAAAKDFYRRTFDLDVTFEDTDSAVFDLGNTLVNLLRTSAAHGLIHPAPVAGPDVGSSMQLTIWVDDADAACATLRERGVTLLNGPMDRPWGQRTACFADPAGHVWEVAQTLPTAPG